MQKTNVQIFLEDKNFKFQITIIQTSLIIKIHINCIVHKKKNKRNNHTTITEIINMNNMKKEKKRLNNKSNNRNKDYMNYKQIGKYKTMKISKIK